MAAFISGRELSRRLALEVVLPHLRTQTNKPFALALLGPGSDVLGFDDETSMDHGWGPRVQVIGDLDELDFSGIPDEFLGLSVKMAGPWHEPLRVYRPDDFTNAILGDVAVSPSDPISFLLVTQQELRSLTQPNVWHDEIGLAARLSPFKQFPKDIKFYLLASLWSRIGEEEHLVGRASMRGDEVGATLIAARVVRDFMRICFLLEDAYAPYPKWFEHAFRQLDCGPEVLDLATRVFDAKGLDERDGALAALSIRVCGLFADRKLVDTQLHVHQFYGRPISVCVADSEVVQALLSRITDPALVHLAKRRPMGSIEMISDSVDVLENHSLRSGFRALFATVD
ncbi:MAG TPA: DUF4037 domain-containing protein [Fimbriimonas sp.]|nr:DUF4037 domain-containing protein [Fimbriimonas sp.]